MAWPGHRCTMARQRRARPSEAEAEMASFKLLGEGYCRGPMASAPSGQLWGRGVMGRNSDALTTRAECEAACAAVGAQCSAYGWGPCFSSYDAACHPGAHNCALYGADLEYNLPATGNWSGIPEWNNYTRDGAVHRVRIHPEGTVGSVQNEHDGNVCWANCNGPGDPCPPPPAPPAVLPPGGAQDDPLGWGTVMLAMMLGVLTTAAAVAVAAKYRVIEVSVPLESPLLAAVPGSAAGTTGPTEGQQQPQGERNPSAESDLDTE
jgi:hypothetical protein